MTVQTDIDKGITDPYVLIRILDKTEDDELVGFFAVSESVAVPEVGETLSVKRSTDQNGEIDSENHGTYNVSERSFSYDLLQERVREEEDQPDRLLLSISLFVTPADQ